MTICTVVRTRIIVPGNSLHLILKDQHVLRLGTDDNVRLNAALFEPFHLGINRSRAHSSGNKQHLFVL